jgi:hypothetical protein
MLPRPPILAIFAALAACSEPGRPDPQLVAEWIGASRTLDASERVTVPDAARISAYASVALYEGYAADPRSQLRSLAGQLNGLWNVPSPARGTAVDGATAAAAAANLVLHSLLQGDARVRTIDSLATSQIARRRSAGVDADVSARSVAHGRTLGQVILRWAADDGFIATRGRAWSAPTSRAQWAETTATEPHWGRLRTFALRNSDECMPPRPPVYSESRGSDFWKMARELFDSVSTLTPDKREAALFWADSSQARDARSFHWMHILHQIIRQRATTADEAAEVYSLTAVAIADALIGSWREKYRSLVVRPVTYAHRVFDARWQPVVATPASPEYPSEHAVVAGAAAEVLANLLGDSLAFTDSSGMSSGHRARTFRGFMQARDEAVAARIYSGVQFVPSASNGKAQGQCIGARVVGRLQTRAKSR